MIIGCATLSVKTQQAMLDALRQWQVAEWTKDKEELFNARASRDEAIELAKEELGL